MIKQSKHTPMPIPLQLLIGYYGILQTVHLGLLVRAVWILQSTGSVPFPAPPPVDGWSSQVLPFLIAMGALDGVAAILGVVGAIAYFAKKQFNFRVWMTSVVIAISSGVIFIGGTISSGAWQNHLVAYGLLAFIFGPIFPLYFVLYRFIGRIDS